MAGVRSHAEASDLAQDVCAAFLGVLQFFQQEHRGAFAHHKSFPVGGKRTTGAAGIAVADGEYPHGLPTTDHAIGQRCIASAGQNHVRHAELDQVESFADRVTCGGTRRRSGKRRPLRAILHADLRSGCIVHHLRDREGV